MMEKTRKNNSSETRQKFSRVHLLFALLIVIVIFGGIYFASRSGTDPRLYTNDFNVYYHAAREVIAGRDPYQDSLRPSTPYLYPPLLSELIIPLALLPLPVAAYVWYLISVFSILSAAWMAAGLGSHLIHSDQRDDSHGLRVVIAAGALFMLIRFVLDNFDFGQVNTLVAALTVAHVYYYAKEKRVVSALALALAISIKLTPAILILYHLAKLRLRFTAICLSMLILVSVFSFLPFGSRGPDAFTVFVERTIKNGQGFDLAFSGNQSLRGAVARLTESADQKPDMYGGQSTRKPVSVTTLAISVALVGLAMLAAVIARTEMAAAAPFFCCLVLLSPLSWKAHFVVLIFPLAYLITRMLEATGKERAYLIGVLIVVFALFNITSPKVFGPEWGEWTDAHSLVCAGALLTYSAAVWQAPRRFVNLK